MVIVVEDNDSERNDGEYRQRKNNNTWTKKI